MINLLNFLPINFETVNSYFTMLRSSPKSSSFDSSKIDEVFMAFYEYILKNLLLNDEANLKINDKDKGKRFLPRVVGPGNIFR